MSFFGFELYVQEKNYPLWIGIGVRKVRDDLAIGEVGMVIKPLISPVNARSRRRPRRRKSLINN